MTTDMTEPGAIPVSLIAELGTLLPPGPPCPFDLIQSLPDGDLLIGTPIAGYWRLSEALA